MLGRLDWGSQLSGRDRKAANHTVDGLLRLLFPNPGMPVSDEDLAWAAELALEFRRRIKEQQAFIGEAEFGMTSLSYLLGNRRERVVHCEESSRYRELADEVSPASRKDLSLPEPDPQEVTTSRGTRAREYQMGDVIADRFAVEEVLGSGGFSRVYKVLDRVEGEQRALKLFDNAAGYDAVRREINALRKVRHPHVVEVIWADKTSKGEWYLIMEFVEGELLTDYASGEKRLRDREAVDVALDVLDALIAIHPDSVRLGELEEKHRSGELSADDYYELQELKERGLVHRDIKPQNIMLTRQGAKLLDFNIASRVGEQVITVSGTPAYQPPEADLTRWDVSTDLFAVGVTLYQLLCNGEHPYANGQPMIGEEVRDPRQFRPNLDAKLAGFLRKACAPYRDDRVQTAVQMKSELEVIRSAM